MCPDTLTRQKGFSLPIAVFILVIMALLAVGIAELSSRSNLSAAQEELSNRAFYAAESAASWGMSRLFFNAGGSADKAFSDNACAAIGGSFNMAFNQPGLRTCFAVIGCSAQTANSTGYYRIASIGTCGTGQAQAIRRIEVGGKNGD